MCNNLLNAKPIPKTGTGYKLFCKHINYSPAFYGNSYVKYNENKNQDEPTNPLKRWVIWKAPVGYGDGFCFFLTRKEAKKCLSSFYRDYRLVIRKIKYRKGLGKRLESGISRNVPFEIALCKEFKIIENTWQKKLCIWKIKYNKNKSKD